MNYLLQHLLINSSKNYPDKTAVIFNDEKITYKELDDVTNQLANFLYNIGITKGDRVGIYINKSIPSIISILGILKAGAVYVPIDPNSPIDRVFYIINNCGIRCLLTSSEKRKVVFDNINDQSTLKMLVLTDETEIKENKKCEVVNWEKIKNEKKAPCFINESINSDLAYILYTSGSTGEPKGVMITHLNSLTFIDWAYETINVETNDILSSHAPFHFDLSIFDIFVSLKAGATLVIVPEYLSTFPIKLAEWIENNKISIWYSVPSILSRLLIDGEADRYKYSNLHTIIFAGEVFPIKYLKQLKKSIPHANYYNFYGPTETNVITYYKVNDIPDDQVKPVPIGKVCSNMEVFAVNEQGKLIKSPGDEGVLYARGSCVAMGYWADPEKTQKNFVTNLINNSFQERIYKTGDIVTIDEDGNYIFIGRKDHMIKSRGYRIELGEIESVVYSHPAVKEAAIIAVPDELIGNKIGAFICLKPDKDISIIDIQNFCLKKLPKYMIPAFIEFRESLPKTSTGKIDKNNLYLKKLEEANGPY